MKHPLGTLTLTTFGLAVALATSCSGDLEPALEGAETAAKVVSTPHGDMEVGPNGIIRCATRKVDDIEAGRVDREMKARLEAVGKGNGKGPGGGGGGGGGGDEEPPRVTGGVIDVYFHVITSSGGAGNVPMDMITDQMAVMNASFSATGWSFNLAQVPYTANDAWFTGCHNTTDGNAMRAVLRQGGAEALNVYSCDPLATGGLLGLAVFPWNYPSDPTRDGVVFLHTTMPGGVEPRYQEWPYNLGLTLVHEAGHWMGLYHTFQGGCSKTGDYVSDTPAERDPTYGCPAFRDSCKGSPGTDPFTNFMDYTDDACMFEFSSVQDQRMDDMFTAYRSGN